MVAPTSLCRWASVLSLGCLLQVLPAAAFEFSSGELRGSLDTTLSHGLTFRVGDPDEALLEDVNGDDGNRNYDRGLVSNTSKITSDLEIEYGSFGAFVRGTGFIDFENDGGDGRYLSPEARDWLAEDAEILDLYATGAFDVGEVPLDLRIGRHVLNWGESTFVQNGINVINPIDVTRLRLPGSELREALVPITMFSGALAPSDTVEIEGFYQIEWEQTEIDPVGSFFSTTDYVGVGGSRAELDLTSRLPTIEPNDRDERLFVQRAPDRTPSDSGQFGVALRVFAESLGDTEFGFYFMNLHSRLPVVTARTGTQRGILEGLAAAGGAIGEFVIGTNPRAAAEGALMSASGGVAGAEAALRHPDGAAAGAAAALMNPAGAAAGVAAALGDPAGGAAGAEAALRDPAGGAAGAAAALQTPAGAAAFEGALAAGASQADAALAAVAAVPEVAGRAAIVAVPEVAGRAAIAAAPEVAGRAAIVAVPEVAGPAAVAAVPEVAGAAAIAAAPEVAVAAAALAHPAGGRAGAEAALGDPAGAEAGAEAALRSPAGAEAGAEAALRDPAGGAAGAAAALQTPAGTAAFEGALAAGASQADAALAAIAAVPEVAVPAAIAAVPEVAVRAAIDAVPEVAGPAAVAAVPEVAGTAAVAAVPGATDAGGAAAIDRYARDARYIVEYPEDMQIWGVSFNTQLGTSGWAVQGEYSLRRDTPLQIDDAKVLERGLKPVSDALNCQSAPDPHATSQACVQSALASIPPAGGPVRGFVRRDVSQAQITATRVFGPTLGADSMVFLTEAAVTHVHNIPDRSVSPLDGPGGSNADATSFGYRIATRLDYNNAVGAVNLFPYAQFQHDVGGTSPGGLPFVEGRVALTLGLSADYLSRWKAGLGYTLFAGAGRRNLLSDRDFISASLSYSF